jgi:hypothetical protein
MLPWGWATWWDKFKEISIPNNLWDTHKDTIIDNLHSYVGKLYFLRELEMLKQNPKYCWSYYIQQHILAHRLHTLVPATKFTQNIGIGPTSLRTKTRKDPEPNQAEAIQTLLQLFKQSSVQELQPKIEAYLEARKYGSLSQEIRAWLRPRSRLAEWGF